MITKFIITCILISITNLLILKLFKKKSLEKDFYIGDYFSISLGIYENRWATLFRTNWAKHSALTYFTFQFLNCEIRIEKWKPEKLEDGVEKLNEIIKDDIDE